jgi:long-chain fatty acid transport protein
MTKFSFGAALLLVLCMTGRAAASTELNGLFDARSMGMGGTGVAFLDSGGVIPINPANLADIKHLTLTLNGLLFISQPEAPYRITHTDGMGGTRDNYETIRSETIYAPLFYVGGAYRLHERVVFGIGFGPMIGQGTSSKYKPAPELRPELEVENALSAGVVELANTLSFKVSDTLNLGVAWRMTYMTQSINTPLPGRGIGGLQLDREMNPIYGNINVTGLNFAGFQLGVQWKPDPSVSIGLSYRNKVTILGKGTTVSKNPIDGSAISLDTEQPFTNPHSFRAGIAISAIQNKLLFAADVKYLMYAEAWEYLPVTTIRNGERNTTNTVAKWVDAYNVHLGAEYKVTDGLAARAGYIISTTATPEAYAKAFMAPPGVAHCWTGGLGFALGEKFNLDVAASFIKLSTYIYTATPDNAGVGNYASTTGELSLSASYHN